MKLRRLCQSLLASFCLNLVCWAAVSSSVDKEIDPMCYNSRAGLPACNFDLGNCFREEAGVKPAWKVVKPGESGPVVPYQKSYVFLDPTESQGKPRMMKAFVSAGKRAVCVEFFYATAGNASAPVNIYIQDGGSLSLMHHVTANTGGDWKSDHFSCCLPNVQSVKSIAIEGTSTADAVLSLDYIDITASNMPCETDQLSCYPTPPTQPPLDPLTSAPSCAGQDRKTVAPSCDFTSLSSGAPDTCGWSSSPGWTARQKRDGSGRYDSLYSSDVTDAFLLSTSSQFTGSLCVEVQFATDNMTADLSNIFSLSLHDQDGAFFTGHSYNYEDSILSVWKRNTFSACVPKPISWKMRMTSNIKSLQIDYILTRASQTMCESTTEAVTMATETQPSSSPEPTSEQSDGGNAFGPGEKPSSESVRRGARGYGYGIILVVVGCCLVVLASLGAVSWECYKRRQAGLPIFIRMGAAQ